jgi:hypothetical protein
MIPRIGMSFKAMSSPKVHSNLQIKPKHSTFKKFQNFTDSFESIKRESIQGFLKIINSLSNWNFGISGFELYGKLIEE